jgi:predicted dehydrogenase
MGQGIHAMDHFLHLMGDWRSVRAVAGTLDRAIEVEDVSMAIVTFANGAMGSIVNSALSPRQETYVRLDYQKATLELTHLYGYTKRELETHARPARAGRRRCDAGLARLPARKSARPTAPSSTPCVADMDAGAGR